MISWYNILMENGISLEKEEKEPETKDEETVIGEEGNPEEKEK